MDPTGAFGNASGISLAVDIAVANQKSPAKPVPFFGRNVRYFASASLIGTSREIILRICRQVLR